MAQTFFMRGRLAKKGERFRMRGFPPSGLAVGSTEVSGGPSLKKMVFAELPIGRLHTSWPHRLPLCSDHSETSQDRQLLVQRRRLDRHPKVNRSQAPKDWDWTNLGCSLRLPLLLHHCRCYCTTAAECASVLLVSLSSVARFERMDNLRAC